MRTWLCIAMLGVAACQAVPVETGSQAQAVDQQDFCTVKLPLRSKWKVGDKLPLTSPEAVMLSAEIDADKGIWGVYAANPAKPEIEWMLELTTVELRKFALLATSAVEPYGGVRGPIVGCIRNCGHPPEAVIMNYANLYQQLQQTAVDLSASCGK